MLFANSRDLFGYDIGIGRERLTIEFERWSCRFRSHMEDRRLGRNPISLRERGGRARLCVVTVSIFRRRMAFDDAHGSDRGGEGNGRSGSNGVPSGVLSRRTRDAGRRVRPDTVGANPSAVRGLFDGFFMVWGCWRVAREQSQRADGRLTKEWNEEVLTGVEPLVERDAHRVCVGESKGRILEETLGHDPT
ncbi:MAG: hypothetical protein QM784_14060 [Polyangiaceae bacterium]